MLSEEKVRELYKFAKETLINFYSITPECTFHEGLEIQVSTYENILEIPESERISKC